MCDAWLSFCLLFIAVCFSLRSHLLHFNSWIPSKLVLTYIFFCFFFQTTHNHEMLTLTWPINYREKHTRAIYRAAVLSFAWTFDLHCWDMILMINFSWNGKSFKVKVDCLCRGSGWLFSYEFVLLSCASCVTGTLQPASVMEGEMATPWCCNLTRREINS